MNLTIATTLLTLILAAYKAYLSTVKTDDLLEVAKLKSHNDYLIKTLHDEREARALTEKPVTDKEKSQWDDFLKGGLNE